MNNTSHFAVIVVGKGCFSFETFESADNFYLDCVLADSCAKVELYDDKGKVRKSTLRHVIPNPNSFHLYYNPELSPYQQESSVYWSNVSWSHVINPLLAALADIHQVCDIDQDEADFVIKAVTMHKELSQALEYYSEEV